MQLPKVLDLGEIVSFDTKRREKRLFTSTMNTQTVRTLPTTRPIFIPDEQRIAATPPPVEGTTGTSRICEQKSGRACGEAQAWSRSLRLMTLQRRDVRTRQAEGGKGKLTIQRDLSAMREL